MTPEAGRRLRTFVEARVAKERGWTLRLSAEVGVSKQSLHAWFAGKREPRPAHLRRLAEVLGATRAEIMAAMDGETER